jgi:hypothetical protein
MNRRRIVGAGSVLSVTSLVRAYVGAQLMLSGSCARGETVEVRIGGDGGEEFGDTSDTADGTWSITAACPDVEGDDVPIVVTAGDATEFGVIGYVGPQPLMWLDGTRGKTIATGVSLWSDQETGAPINVSQGTTNYQPVDNGDRLTFSLNDMLAADVATNTALRCLTDGTGCEAFLVVRFNAIATGPAQTLLWNGGGLTAPVFGILLETDGVSALRYWTYSTAGRIASSTLTVVAGKKLIIGARYGGSTYVLDVYYEDGNFTTNTDPTIGTPEAGDATYALHVGNRNAIATPFDGDMYDVVVFDALLSDPQRAAHIAALKASHGFAS